MLDLRIVCVDHYLSPPTRGFDVNYSSFRVASVKQVPVIRVFGITPTGMKTCIHIHGVFPYIYVPYDGCDNVHSLMARIAHDIDIGINTGTSSSDQGPSSRHHVFKISLVSGIPFYGYHAKSHQFLKIYFYNPYSIKKAVALLENGSVCNMRFQPHEAHIPYILQFFIDYNLYGMSFMKLSSFRIRHEAHVDNNEIRESQGLYRTSYCELEGDAVAECIMNKISPEDRECAANPGLAAIWAEEKSRRIKEGKSIDSMVQQSQTIHTSQPTSSDFAYRLQLKQCIQERLESLGEETSQMGYAAETPEFANLQDASFRDNHNILDNPQGDSEIVQEPAHDVIFDDNDLELIRMMEEQAGGHKSDDEAEQDSILGSQVMAPAANGGILDDEEEGQEDLTIPFSPVSSGSIFEHELPEHAPPDEYDKVWSPWEESYWTGCANLSQVEPVLDPNREVDNDQRTTTAETNKNQTTTKVGRDLNYVDGPFDSSSSDSEDIETNLIMTPPKKILKIKDTTPDKRYQPLNISVQRSPAIETKITPQKVNITPKKFSPKGKKPNITSDPAGVMKELQKNASQINEKLLSPKSSQSSNKTPVKLSPSSLYNPSDNSEKSTNKNVKEGSSSGFDVKKVKRVRISLNETFNIISDKSTKNIKPTSNNESIMMSQNISSGNSNISKIPVVRLDPAEGFDPLKDASVSGSNRKTSQPASNNPTILTKSHLNRRQKISSVKRKKSKNLRIQVLSNISGSSRKSPLSLIKKNEPFDTISGKHLPEDQTAEKVKKEEQNFSQVRKTLFPENKSQPKKHCYSLRSTHCLEKSDYLDSSGLDRGVRSSSPTSSVESITSKKSDDKILFSPILKHNSQSSDTILNSQTSEKLDPTHSQISDIAVPLINDDDELSRNSNISNKESSFDIHSPNETMEFISQQFDVHFKSQTFVCEEPFVSSPVVSQKYQLNDSPHNTPKSSCKVSFDKSVRLTLDSPIFEDNDDIPEGIISFYNKTVNVSHHNAPRLTGKSNIFTLAYNPPSLHNVLNNMLDFGLSVEKGLMPFYNNPRDSSSSKEVGVEVVKLPSHRISDLEDFIGDMGNPLEESKKLLISTALGKSCLDKVTKTPNLSSHRKIVATPVKKPPTRIEAERWKSLLNNKEEITPTKENVKGILEMAMFGGSQNDSQSLSMTPCTPASSQNSTDSKCDRFAAHSTPAVIEQSVFSPAVTPIASSSMNRVRDSLLPTIDENEESHSSEITHSKSSMATQLDVRSAVCNINNATPDNSGMFKLELQNLQNAHSVSLHRYITLLIAEIHCQTRGDLKPDPEHDSISAIFYCIHNDVPPDSDKPNIVKGVILYCPPEEPKRRYTTECVVTLVPTELDLVQKFVALVREWDPDIVAGYETEMLSWGYIIQRGYVLGLNLAVELGRTNILPFNQPDVNLARGLDVKLTGRIALNIWRLMRHEVALMSYSFENMMYHVMHTRVAKFSFKNLSLWWTHCSLHYREFVIRYYLTRVFGAFQILDQLDFIGSTSELASLFGIQFYEVLSRGSQFRVESMMIRLAKLQNFVPVSPSIRQRAEMRAPACIPLVMEPKSRFYGDPVIVLDFQSLYPSMMIAYNYCFSTCLGRIEHLKQHERFEFGCTELKIPLKQLDELKDKIHISPVGIVFVTPDVRKGIISKMVEEILETRLMVKKSMKDHKEDKLLQRVLHARQLGLKLIANVTYGYTSANFSGRMPSVEIADSIVSKGRETLERVIEMVNSHPTWRAKVVYGDTDSVFVLCPGRTRQEAFVIGQEIADAATRDNPRPVKLKLEKVYQPCILQTKKRYVGFMYESPDQAEPVYDAKGIETVRRDGCPAVSKILEKSLKILFKTRDVSQVKDFVCNQMSKLFTGRINIQDVTFAKEYRGIYGYKPGACVPALKIAKEILQVDRRGEPRPGERVGYVVVCGPPGVPLIRLTTPPYQLIQDPSLRINPEYYILKAILPPLDRCFTLLGANVFAWYQEFPKKFHVKVGTNRIELGMKKSTISQYFNTMKCVLCGEMTTSGVCSVCQNYPHIMAAGLAEKTSSLEYKYSSITKVCESCCERKVGLDCVSFDCPVMFRRIQATRDLSQIDFIRQLSNKFLSEMF